MYMFNFDLFYKKVLGSSINKSIFTLSKYKLKCYRLLFFIQKYDK